MGLGAGGFPKRQRSVCFIDHGDCFHCEIATPLNAGERSTFMELAPAQLPCPPRPHRLIPDLKRFQTLIGGWIAMSLRVVGSTSRRAHRDFQTDYRAGTARSTLPDVQNLFVIGMRLARTSTGRARSTRSCPRPHLRQSPVLLAADFGILHRHPLE